MGGGGGGRCGGGVWGGGGGGGGVGGVGGGWGGVGGVVGGWWGGLGMMTYRQLLEHHAPLQKDKPSYGEVWALRVLASLSHVQLASSLLMFRRCCASGFGSV